MILFENRSDFRAMRCSEAPVVAARKAPKILNLHVTRPEIDPDFRLGAYLAQARRQFNSQRLDLSRSNGLARTGVFCPSENV
jgi:hypothetical protein